MSKTSSKTAALPKKARAWRTYELAAQAMVQTLSGRLKLRGVEGKQRHRGKRSGTRWEIDAKAIDTGDGRIIVVEVRRHTRSRLDQEAVGGVAYRIRDLEAGGAIVVSPLPLQKGAAMVAKAENIRHIQMSPESTPEQWFATFEDLLHAGFVDTVATTMTETLTITIKDETGRVVSEETIL